MRVRIDATQSVSISARSIDVNFGGQALERLGNQTAGWPIIRVKGVAWKAGSGLAWRAWKLFGYAGSGVCTRWCAKRSSGCNSSQGSPEGRVAVDVRAWRAVKGRLVSIHREKSRVVEVVKVARKSRFGLMPEG
eukprot:COSAG01_NODE_135_length_24448_cov_154.590086_2_plen_134_part_00